MSELCVPGCRYRNLYEGSQTSLADMAAKQVQSVGDHQSIRKAILGVVKRYFPRDYTALEKQLNQRLTDLEDDVIVAVLDQLLGSLAFGDGDGVDSLKHALLHAGFAVEGENLSEWAQTVASGPSGSVAAATVEGFVAVENPPSEQAVMGDTPYTAPVNNTWGEDVLPAPDGEPVPGDQIEPGSVGGFGDIDDLFGLGAPNPTTPGGGGEGFSELDDLFAELDNAGAGGALQKAPEGLDDLFGPEGGGDAGGNSRDGFASFGNPFVELGNTPQNNSENGSVGASAPFGELPGKETTSDTTASGGFSELDDLFGDPPAGKPSGGFSELDDLFGDPPAGKPSGGFSELDDLFGDPPAGKPSGGFSDGFSEPGAKNPPSNNTSNSTSTNTDAGTGAVTSPTRRDTEDNGRAGSVPTNATPPLTSAVRKDEQTHQHPTVAAAVAAATDSGENTVVMVNKKALQLPLKPAVVSTKKAAKRPIRTKATRADVPEADTGGDIDDRTRQALLAAVAIPRPVFVSDLSAIAGSRAAVEDWEREMRELKTAAPVRLIGGKSRHRMRGSLVIPHGDLRSASKEFNTGWWADCLDKYSGARLYELSVLLHRCGQDVISYDFDNDVAVLHVTDKRGLVGMVVVVGDELEPGGATRQRLSKVLEGVVKERLALIVVAGITVNAENDVAAAVIQEAANSNWQVNAPVVYANSWEWADDAGTTSKLLLGG